MEIVLHGITQMDGLVFRQLWMQMELFLIKGEHGKEQKEMQR